jgi:hypothetical protein
MLYITDWRQLRVGRTDRATVIGATGTGKTTLCRYLVEDPAKRCSVVYDAKISDAITRWQTTQRFFDSFDLLQRSEEDRLVYRPSFGESIDAAAQDDFFGWIYWRRYTRLYIDEATALQGGVNPSWNLQACLARGREHGVSTVIATQRPKRVPLILFSESEHFFIFRLNLIEDRLRVYELTGIDPVEQTSLENHEFFYYSALTGQRSNRLKLNPASVSPTTRGLHLVGGTNARARKTASTLQVQHAAA